jgi:hypothetical protein
MQRILKPELKFAASTVLLERGCVNVIGLEEIKVKAGSRWKKMHQSICAHLETLLRQKLGPADYFSQLDDLSFLLCMPTATQEESQVFCVRVAHELHTSLLGRCDIDQLRIARAAALDGDTLELDSITGESLVRLADHAGLTISPKGARSASTASARSGSQPGAQSVTHSHRFGPIWDVQKEAITTYRCATLADQSLFDSTPPSAKFKADLGALLARVRHATRTLATSLEIGQRFLMSIPVSFDLLSSPVARMELTAICRSLSSALRPYLMFEIGELPYGVTQSRLSELVGSLRPFCRGVSAILPAHIPNYNAYQGTGLYAIGLSLAPNSVGVTEIGSDDFESCFSELCAAAKRLHIKCCVLEVPSIEAVRYARDIGVNTLLGFLIGAPLEVPAPIRRLYMRDIEEAASNTSFLDAPTVRRSVTIG